MEKLQLISKNKTVIIIEKQVREDLEIYRPTGKKDLETGGYFLGEVDEKNIRIKETTKPCKEDNRTQDMFVAGEKHIDYIFEQNKQSEGKLIPLGHWHTHPGRVLPRPSKQDERIWKAESNAWAWGNDFLIYMIMTNTQIKFFEVNKGIISELKILGE